MNDDTTRIPTVRLLDISGIFHPLWRAKEARGEPVGKAAIETVQALRERCATSGADYVVACCDSGRTFRHTIGKEWQALNPSFAGYKGNRAEKDPALIGALDRVVSEIESDGIPIFKVAGFEADDALASATKWAVENGLDVEIVTDDKDLFQLVTDGAEGSPSVRIVRRDGSVVGPAEVLAKFKVAPAKLGELLAIMGDASDHVPGVSGIGLVNAAKIIAEHGGYAEAVEKATKEEAALASRTTSDSYVPTFTAAQRKKLIEGKPAFDFSLRLTQLRDDVPLDFAAITAPRKPTARPNKTQWHEAAPQPEPQTPIYVFGEEEEEPMPVESSANQNASELLPPIPEVTGESVAATPAAAQASAIVTSSRAIVRLSPEEFRLALEPQTYEMARTVAEDMFDSGLFAVARAQAALALIQVGRAHGLSAVTSLMEIHMIEGKPQMSAKLMVALVRKSKKADYFKLVESGPTGAKWKTHRKDDPDPDPVFGSFTIEEAKKALLGGISSKGKDGVITVATDFKADSQYAKYPEDMCVWRAAVRLIRREYSDVIGGLYATEEMDEYAATTPYSAAA